MKKKVRVLVATHQQVELPESIEGLSDKEIAPWKMEYDVISALEELGHEARLLCMVDELTDLRVSLREWKPHIVFNLLEAFRGLGINIPYVLGYLELLHQPYTGCNPYGFFVADNKTLMKKILRYHRISVPRFAAFPRGRAVKVGHKLTFPVIVKSATEHGSIGISQASIVNSDEKLKERVEFVFDQLETDVVVEEYIEGRELYVGVMGNRRLEAFPLRELQFKNLPEGAPRIMTQKLKSDMDYQEKIGVATEPATDLPDGAEERIHKMCKRVYRTLALSGYARMDVRLTEAGKVYLLEPNPNPELTYGEDFSEAANTKGISYEQLIQRILNLGLRYPSNRLNLW